ncbi:MAG: hypothetical protein RLY95_1907 [Pseudomonadota bacterium]|jgi:cell division protein FtsB
MASRLTTYILLALLLVFQGQLWIGRGSVFHVRELERKLAAQEHKNAEAKKQNERLLADIRDLKDGMGLIEDRARHELGMIKPNEIFVQYAK